MHQEKSGNPDPNAPNRGCRSLGPFFKKDGGERLDRVEKLKKLARFKDEQNNLVYIYIYRSLDCVHN
jgi:hypothetical protein